MTSLLKIIHVEDFHFSLEVFRAMTTIDTSSVFHGVAYVIWVKHDKDFKSPVVIYGIARKGSSKFGHQDFKYVCEVNGLEFISRKVDEGNVKPSWQDCLDEMKVCRVENGEPRFFNDQPYSFADIAAAAYKEGIFNHKDGLAILAKKSKPSKSASSKSLEMGNNNLLVKAKEVSDKLNTDKGTEGMTFGPQHQYIIPGSMPNPCSFENVENEVTVVSQCADNSQNDSGISLVESTPKDDTDQTPSPLQLQLENAELRAKLGEVSAKLQASKEAQAKFMVAGDKLSAENQALNEDTASTVMRHIDPKLALLPTIHTDIGGLSSKVSELKQVVDTFSGLLTSANDSTATNVNSMSEDVKGIKNSLENFGIDEFEEGVSIPDVLMSIKSPKGCIKGTEQGCFFESRSIPAVYICSCGCGREVQLEPKPFQGIQGQQFAGQQAVHSYNVTETGQTEPMLMVGPKSNTHFSPKSHMVVQCDTSPFPLLQNPPYPNQNVLPYPPAEDFPSYYSVQNTVQDPRLTRKEKRLQKNKEFYAKKRKPVQNSEEHVASAEENPSRSQNSDSRPNISPWLDSSSRSNDGPNAPQKFTGGIWIN